MKIDTKELNEKLKALTGNDFEECERQERAAGNYVPDIAFSNSFQARLAGMALNVNPHDIKELPLNEYVAATRAVYNFFFKPSDQSQTETQENQNQ